MRTVLKTAPGAAAVSLVFAAMALASWRAWGDPVADFPKQLYMAWRVAEGEILYRDVRHFYGPLSQLLNGGIFALFGTGYLTLALANLVVAWSLALLLYFVIARYADCVTAFVAASTFILAHAFQHLGQNASYNFIAPYSHEATHGTLLLLVALALATGASTSSSTWRWRSLGATLGALTMTKPEFILASVTMVAALILLEWRSSSSLRGAFLRIVGALAIGMGMVLATGVAYFVIRGQAPLSEAVLWTLGAVTPLWFASALANPIYGQVSGLSVLDETLPAILTTLSIIVGVLIGAVCIDLLTAPRLRRGLGIVYLSSLVVLSYLSSGIAPPYSYSYALPLLATFGVLMMLALRLRGGVQSATDKFALLTGVAAVAMSVKIYFNATFWWMGFSLLVPSTIFLVILGMRVLPGLLWTIRPRAFVVRWTTVAVVGAMSIHVARGSLWTYGTKDLALGEGVDRFYVFGYSPESQLMAGAIERLRDTTEPGSTLMLFPGGVLANYLLRRENPTPFVANLGSRTWYESSGGMAAIVESLEREPPDYIVYLRTPPQFPGPVYQIWGPEGFANGLIEWIAAHYDEVDRIGPDSQNFGELIYVLLKKRQGASVTAR